MKIAIQGEFGSFSHQAALKFDSRAEVVKCVLPSDAIGLLQDGSVEAVALPIENTLAGSVVEHYDLLLAGGTTIRRELVMRIAHQLIGLPGSALEAMHRVYSHPVALAQCRRFLAEHPRLEAVPFYDTAGAVKELISMRDRHAAAIAGEQAAVFYGAEILAAGIEDNPANFTRFLLVQRAGAHEAGEEMPRSSVRKQTFAFRLHHRTGALAGALHVIAEAGANITKIQSRPLQGQPWVYTFYVDCLVDTDAQAEALGRALEQHTLFVRELGRYPPATGGTDAPVL